MAFSYILGCVFALALTMVAAEEGRKAIAVLTNEDNTIKGTINFTQDGAGQEVKVTGSISGLPIGEHGFHIHEKGDITAKCVGAAGHFNPEKKTHGAPNDTVRHVGDLGNINTTSSDPTIVDITDKIISLYGAHSIIGRSVVVHENRDDLGLGNHSTSSTTGNAGGRLACGVIGIQTPVVPWNTGAANSLAHSLATAVMSVLLVTLLKELVM